MTNIRHRGPGRRHVLEMTIPERLAHTGRPPRQLAPESPRRPEIREEIYSGVRTSKGKVRGQPPPPYYVPK